MELKDDVCTECYIDKQFPTQIFVDKKWNEKKPKLSLFQSDTSYIKEQNYRLSINDVDLSYFTISILAICF